MYNMALFVVLHNCHKDVLCGECVVCIGIINGLERFHGVGGSPLFSQMHHHIRFKFSEQIEEFLFLLGDVELGKTDIFASQLLPACQSLLNGFDGCDAGVAILIIDFTTREVINNEHIPSIFGHPECERPADESITSCNENFHFGVYL